MLTWLEATDLATTVRNSLMVTAVLSALHAVGFTLVMGSSLMVNLRRTGLLLAAVPLRTVTGPAHRGLIVGVTVSVGTGLLLFAPRATAAAANSTFQLKMLLLVSAVGLQSLLGRRARAAEAGSVTSDRLLGSLGLVLWIGLAVTACAFILFE